MARTATPDRPLIGIGVIVWRDDKVLLIKRKNPPGAGQWGLPGGKQELGETIMQAAAREVREETGLSIKPLGFVTAIDSIVKNEKGKIDFHYTIIEVAAEAPEGEAKAATDALDVKWATLEEIEELCSWKEVARVVRLSMLERVL